MTIFKKGLLRLSVATMFLGTFLFTANAAGPLGAPPTQNVSPTFSDVTVQGKVVTQSVKPAGDFNLIVNALNNIYLGNPFAPGAQLWLAAKDIFTSGNLTVLNKLFIGDVNNTGLSITTDNAKGMIDVDAAGKHLRFLSSKGDINIGDPNAGAVPNNITIWGKAVNLLSDVNPINIVTNGGDLKLSGSKVDIFSNNGITLNSSVGGTKIIGKIVGALNVDGHLKATSIGMFYENLAPSIDFNGELMKSGYSYCKQYEELTGCNFTAGTTAQITSTSEVLKTFDNNTNTSYNPPIEGCYAGFYNPGQKSGFSVQVRAMCFNPNY